MSIPFHRAVICGALPRRITVIRRTVVLLVLLGGNFSSCAQSPRYTRSSSAAESCTPAREVSPGPVTKDNTGTGFPAGSFHQTGSATYYANKFHGRRTANGERYDRAKFTAAHRTLPFGTVVRVTRISNGKRVTVRVNDRGPLKKGRIIDLSRAAAEQIDMISAGVVDVGIEIVKE